MAQAGLHTQISKRKGKKVEWTLKKKEAQLHSLGSLGSNLGIFFGILLSGWLHANKMSIRKFTFSVDRLLEMTQ